MNKNVYWFVLAGMLAVSCSPEKKTYVIHGTVPDGDFNGQRVYMNGYSEAPLDSALVVDGRFTFTGTPDTGAFVRLDLDRLFTNVVREEGTVEVDLSDPALIGGTPLNDALRNYLAELNDFYDSSSEEYGRIMEGASGNEAAQFEQLEALRQTAQLRYNAILAAQFEANRNNLTGSRIFIDWTNYLSPEETDSLYAELGAHVRNVPPLPERMQVNETKKRTAVGQMFTDFTVENGKADGTPVSFSDYIGKGKYVLVDFWASWCGPCLAENPVIAEVYRKYRGDRFEVLGVAVWDDRNETLEAIRTHGIAWPQILDARTVPTDLYGINGIPHIILFGPDGVILARNLRGNDLKSKIAEALSEE
jgi:thiol-disulfide isomerase/thioredoxin